MEVRHIKGQVEGNLQVHLQNESVSFIHGSCMIGTEEIIEMVTQETYQQAIWTREDQVCKVNSWISILGRNVMSSVQCQYPFL